ncbi:MAG TPA: class I SAM-dependent methyltransferase [Vicinamibacterales bacterium]|nr:class I SAM-dependent methyltransferase [Vicinamibacterales bacterium]
MESHDHLSSALDQSALPRGSSRLRARLLRDLDSGLRAMDSKASFTVGWPDGDVQHVGPGSPTFGVTLVNSRGVRAVATLDELSFCEAYMAGDIDIDGSMEDLLRLRGVMHDHRPLKRLVSFIFRYVLDTAWLRRRWIGHHYDEPIELFSSFLDPEHLCYSHGFFESADEPLETAMTRKLEYAIAATRLEPGMRVLDIGGGWGSFLRFAGRRGIHVTSLTISPRQFEYMTRAIAAEALPCEVLMQDVYTMRVPDDRRFDAIVNLGVTEHLPDYARLTAQYRRLLKPGRRVYFDSCASEQMYDVGTFIAEHIFQGTTSYLCISRFLAEAANQHFEIDHILNDRRNYELTSRKWGERLESNREYVVRHVGERTYRKFRLLIWSCAAMFDLNVVTAYRVVLRG